jgi:predicted transglutaminase-like cysteine proteinase
MNRLAILTCVLLASCTAAPPKAIRDVQHEMNAVRYVADPVGQDVPTSAALWRGADHFKTVGGDCEDYAMAKCERMEALGHDCKIVIGFLTSRSQYHAVAVVDNTYWLDNLAANRNSYHQPKGFVPVGKFDLNDVKGEK